jgi:Rrf2 family protein
MSANSRFAVAIHTLAFLAFAERAHPEHISSEVIAGSVNTNPVVIRRLLGTLRHANLVMSQPGSGGGWRLTRRADEINLRDVYQAVKEGPLFASPPRSPDPHCMVGRNVQHAIDTFFADAETALEQSLAQATVADVVQRIASSLGDTCEARYEGGPSMHDNSQFALPPTISPERAA